MLTVAKLTAVVELPTHTTWLVTAFTWPSGFTVMVKLFDGPGQLTLPLVKVGVTVMVATTGAVPVLSAVKEDIFPVPLEASPIEAVVFVQL